mgnify:CR=1 FL=1
MATNYNITMKRYNGTDYDVLYPRTLPSQIDGGVYTKDEATGLFLSKTGGQMSGLLDMNGNKISNLATPTAANDAATKDYVDNNSYMWNKEYVGELTTDGQIIEFDYEKAKRMVGLYIEATATTIGKTSNMRIDLDQDISDFSGIMSGFNDSPIDNANIIGMGYSSNYYLFVGGESLTSHSDPGYNDYTIKRILKYSGSTNLYCKPNTNVKMKARNVATSDGISEFSIKLSILYV